MAKRQYACKLKIPAVIYPQNVNKSMFLDSLISSVLFAGAKYFEGGPENKRMCDW